jgi:hypothetical protein
MFSVPNKALQDESHGIDIMNTASQNVTALLRPQVFLCVCMLVHGSSERKLKLQLHGHVTLSSCWWRTFLCASMMTKAFLGLLRKFLAPQISLKTLPSRVVRQRNLLALQSDFPTNTFEKQLVI